MKRCHYCTKHKDLSEFALSGKGKVLSVCKICHPKKLAQAKESNAKPDVKKRKALHLRTTGKDAHAKYRASDKGKAVIKKQGATMMKKRKTDSDYAKRERFMLQFRKYATGEWKALKDEIAKETEFKTSKQIRDHFKDIEDKTIAHKVPKVYYDHNNPTDVKNCWSRANLGIATAEANMSAGVKIDPAMCIEIGMDKLPVAWNRAVPSESARAELEAWARGSK